jgi:hypothetical protein
VSTAWGQSAPATAPVQWGAVTRAEAGAGRLLKNAGCSGCADSGGVSAHLVPADGAVEFLPALGAREYAGLADRDVTLPSAATMPFAFSLWPDGGWDIRERGTYRADGRYAAGDVFGIRADGGAVRYTINGRVVYTSAAVMTAPLRFGALLYTKGASLSSAAIAAAAGGPAFMTYAGVSDQSARLEPLLPVPGPAGTALADPTFGTTIVRVTDGLTRPSKPGRSFRTPSGTHQHAWSALGTYFYVVSNDGTIIPFVFDGRAGQAARIQPTATGAGGLTLKFFNEAQFSYANDQQIYATYNGSGATLRTIDQYDFSTGAYTRLFDLDALVPGLAGTYVGGLNSSAGAVERIVTFFGGTGQDRHHYILVFDKNDPSHRRLLDTVASTLDGLPLAAPLAFKLHHVTIDRTGRFVLMYPTSADLAAPRLAEHIYVWDTQTDAITPVTAAAHPNGHDAPGYGTLVNQDCCSTTKWDAAEWQFRSLAAPLVTRDLILPSLAPKEIYLADHPAWQNARPDASAPYFSALYRYGANTTAWRAWDDEIVAVQTDAPVDMSATVWRLAHHRSDVANDADPSRIYFWYTPRPNVSPDGRWVLFTSNWEKTLGADTAPEPGGGFRQDVFLLRAR